MSPIGSRDNLDLRQSDHNGSRNQNLQLASDTKQNSAGDIMHEITSRTTTVGSAQTIIDASEDLLGLLHRCS